jgi:UDP-N-acetylglucosamine--N-acetylmuramyl-(pentapeptide) pyrophosphoryl-undecaprenol N-acetylglucosamine transferase
MKRPILLAAGGTGGHLFPAEALATALMSRGCIVHLATDERATRYGKTFPAAVTHEIPSATPSGRSPGALLGVAGKLGHGLFRSWSMLGSVKPAAVVGFGGYPTVPPVLAAALRGIPTIVHEQNGVLGRANRMLAPFVKVIATGFPTVKGVKPQQQAKLRLTGNPVRPAVLEAASKPFEPLSAEGVLRLVVFGGSQGARVMSDIVPLAIETLPVELRSRISIVQQAREEDLDRVHAVYARLSVPAEVSTFFADMPSRIAAGHLVVARSGASTVAELAVIGRPAILVPLPHSLDGDQAANAITLENTGAAVVIPQSQFTPDRLADEIAARLREPQSLTRAAEAAKSAGVPDAADRLATLVLEVARD